MIFKKHCIVFFTFTNSEDPDELQHCAAFHLGLHCLQKYSFRDFPEYKGLIKRKSHQTSSCLLNQHVFRHCQKA